MYVDKLCNMKMIKLSDEKNYGPHDNISYCNRNPLGLKPDSGSNSKLSDKNLTWKGTC